MAKVSVVIPDLGGASDVEHRFFEAVRRCPSAMAEVKGQKLPCLYDFKGVY